ncbi:nucleotidyltransferase domain-containing protein [Nocardia neocaledoniensis]|uniref:nucleotidyltransferase domain-containing protein n=1 Tax=Nocardia neocaledoniensis TaxID=236511 RepID=UPI002456AFDE|nr:nucleotidyltransferase domain-containing protein [Nocardia neocaledoniensis]
MKIVPSEIALDAMCEVARSALPPSTPRAVVVYGSFGRNQQRPSSDLDVLFVGARSAGALEALTEGLVDFSRRNCLTLDEEVPYANKLLADWDELSTASTCAMFAGSPRLTPVRRTDQAYLASSYMRRRLFVTGVLAQRTLSWSENAPLLEALQARAGAGLIGAAIDDLRSAGVAVDPDSVISYVTGDAQGIPPEDWLGFEPDSLTRTHLRCLADQMLSRAKSSSELNFAT